MSAIYEIDGKLLKEMIIAAANELSSEKANVDALNVFPVPDGDTGTNMSYTTLAAAREVEKLADSATVSEVAKAASSGSLRGARGNSGVILSQLFRGFSKGLDGKKTAGIDSLVDALRYASETAYKAVMKPKEGTVLTVARMLAEKADELAYETEDIQEFMKELLVYGEKVLASTMDMLPQLKQAGVIDAGGRGLLLLFYGAYKRLSGDKVTELETVNKSETDFSALETVDTADITFGYCTEFFINTPKAEDENIINGLKGYLSEIGDSIVVVSDNDIIKVHVHSDNPGKVIEKALSIGSLTNIKIDNMREQHTSKLDLYNSAGADGNQNIEPTQQEEEEYIAQDHKDIGFVAVASGAGICELFKNLGVDIIIEGGQTMNPSTEDILTAVEKINADNVIILPNNKNIVMSAEQAAKLCKSKKVHVLPTKNIPQGVTALVTFQAGQDVSYNMKEMEESYSTLRTGQITCAVRDTQVNGVDITEGHLLGILDGDIEVCEDDLYTTAMKLIEKMVNSDSSLVCIYYGEDVAVHDAELLAKVVADTYADCEVEVHNGQQPIYHYLISVE